MSWIFSSWCRTTSNDIFTGFQRHSCASLYATCSLLLLKEALRTGRVKGKHIYCEVCGNSHLHKLLLSLFPSFTFPHGHDISELCVRMTKTWTFCYTILLPIEIQARSSQKVEAIRLFCGWNSIHICSRSRRIDEPNGRWLWPFFLVVAAQNSLCLTSFPSPALRVCHDIHISATSVTTVWK